MNQTQLFPCLLWFCYEGETHTRNDEIKQHKEKHRNNKEAYIDESKSAGQKVGFATVFVDIIRKEE